MVPFLSIVTISFNQASFLRQTIESVLAEKADDIEYIVVDPGSTDGSRDLIQSYGDKIDQRLFDPDKGAADGLNKGFAAAKGALGYFLNSDDFLLPGAISKIRQQWQSHPHCDAILGAGWMVDGAGKPIRPLRSTKMALSSLRRNEALFVQHGLSFKMDFFRKVGGFNPENRTCWDFELLAEFVRCGAKMALSNARIGAFRLHGESLSGGGHGEAHEARFRADVERIYTSLFGADQVAEIIRAWDRGRLTKYLANPGVSLSRLWEKAVPGAVERMWQADMDEAARA